MEAGEVKRNILTLAREVQGKGGVYLAGAWAGYGFHEDGLKAGIAVAQALGATLPWRPRAANPKVGRLAECRMNNLVVSASQHPADCHAASCLRHSLVLANTAAQVMQSR